MHTVFLSENTKITYKGGFFFFFFLPESGIVHPCLSIKKKKKKNDWVQLSGDCVHIRLINKMEQKLDAIVDG